MEHDDLTLLGASVRQPVKKLETFPAHKSMGEVVLRSEEVTSLCPVTGQPDFSTVTVSYYPDKRCLESKSLKLYLWSFREQGVFCEALAVQICEDVCKVIHPFSCTVIVEQHARGGISIKAQASNHRGIEEIVMEKGSIKERMEEEG